MMISLPLLFTFTYFLGLGQAIAIAIAAFPPPRKVIDLGARKRKSTFSFSLDTAATANVNTLLRCCCDGSSSQLQLQLQPRARVPVSDSNLTLHKPKPKPKPKANEKVSLALEATSISSKQSTDIISKVFDKYASLSSNNNKNVGLDKWGLFGALAELDVKVTQEGCQALLEEFDTEKKGNGVVDRDEFTTLFQQKIAKDVFEIFYAFEFRGYLTPGKLRSALGALSVDLNSREAKELVEYYGANGDGKLGPLGFAQLVSRSPTAKFWLKIDRSGHIRKIKASLINSLKAGPKKVVSRHSTLATIYTGMTLYSLSMLWAPGVDALGSRRILDLMCTFSIEQERMFRCTSLLSAFVAFSGTFRISANSTGARHNLFMATVCFVMNCAVTAESNLCLMPHLALIDAWSLSGRALVDGTTIAMFYFAFKLLHNSIVDPVEEFKTLPMMTSMPTAILSSVLIVIGIIAIHQHHYIVVLEPSSRSFVIIFPHLSSVVPLHRWIIAVTIVPA